MGVYNQYKLKYKTFNQLLDSVMDDMEMYDKNQLIEPTQLLKIVRKINSELGLRITKTKDAVIPFENFVAKLPDDFYHINYAVLCGDYQITYGARVSGDHTEGELVQGCTTDTSYYKTDCGDSYIVIKTNKPSGEIVSYKLNYSIDIKEKRAIKEDEVCAYISLPFIRINNIREGNLYINYESDLVNEEGELLVLDHPLINNYYEYALKRRILENVYLNGEESALQKLQFIEPRYIVAQKEANGVVDMPDFKEFKNALDINRKAAHKRFYSIFYV